MSRTKNRRGPPRRGKRPETARVENNVERHSGIGSQYDYGEGQSPSSGPVTPFMQDRFAVDLYYNDWAAKKIINIPVEDMLRDGWSYEGVDDDQSALIVTQDDSLGILTHLKQAMRLERLIGGCVIFLGVDDGQDDASQPVAYENLKQGCLKFINVVPRTRVSNTKIETNPLSPLFGRPTTYTINGIEVHHTRLLIFRGDPLLSAPDSTIMPSQLIRNDGFGVSVLMCLIDDLTRATGTRQAAYQLAQRASVFLFQSDLTDLTGTKGGESAISKMQNIVNQINLFRGAVLDRQPGEADPITTISPQFGSVPELVITFLQVLSAAADIPATRFLGQAPGGLNATGESDLENYYGGREAEQRQKIRPEVLKYLRVAGPSAIGDQFSKVKIDVKFKPLWSLSELEQSQVRTADTANILAVFTANLISDAEAMEELKLRDVLVGEIEMDDPVASPEADADPDASLASALAELKVTP